MNGGTRLSYYNYTIEVKKIHVLFYISMLTFSIYLSFVYFVIYYICDPL